MGEDVQEFEAFVKEEESAEWYVKATDLHKSYNPKGLHAVCGNTFGVEKGTIVGLLGPNGAGKSTTFGMLSMERPRSSG